MISVFGLSLSMPENQNIIHSFYSAFQRKDSMAMGTLYHEDATFEDPAFGKLSSDQAKSMWAMLVARGGENLKIEFEIIHEDAKSAQVIWQAWYEFSKTKRPVHNVITASFDIKDGKIIKHVDKFSFWKWSRMALGTPGLLLGWSPLIKNKVRKESLKILHRYMTAEKIN